MNWNWLLHTVGRMIYYITSLTRKNMRCWKPLRECFRRHPCRTNSLSGCTRLSKPFRSRCNSHSATKFSCHTKRDIHHFAVQHNEYETSIKMNTSECVSWKHDLLSTYPLFSYLARPLVTYTYYLYYST